MSELPPLPRIITTHNEAGVATIQKADELAPKSATDQRFVGVKSAMVWTTKSVPAKDNNEETDGATRTVDGDLGIVSRGGTTCVVTDLAPGATATWHRTSSVDHNVLISGKLVLMLEDGTEQLIDRPGTVVIQKGTMHAWKNPGPEWSRWLCVLVDAEPAVVSGKTLGAAVIGMS